MFHLLFLDQLPVFDILKLGFIGLAFLFAYLAFRLLSREQRSDSGPKKNMLIAIYIFMGFSLLLAGLSILSKVLEDNDLKAKNTQLEKRLSRLTPEKWTIHGKIIDYYDTSSLHYYFMPPEEAFSTLETTDGIEFWFKDLPIVKDSDSYQFPQLGFQAKDYFPTKPYKIDPGAESNMVTKTVELARPIILSKRR